MITRARRRVVWTSPAEEDLTVAALWYGDQYADLVEPFLEAVRQAANRAAESPELYAKIRGTMRRVMVRRFPYALAFRESREEIVILACYHLHREPTFWQQRG